MRGQNKPLRRGGGGVLSLQGQDGAPACSWLRSALRAEPAPTTDIRKLLPHAPPLGLLDTLCPLQGQRGDGV